MPFVSSARTSGWEAIQTRTVSGSLGALRWPPASWPSYPVDFSSGSSSSRDGTTYETGGSDDDVTGSNRRHLFTDGGKKDRRLMGICNLMGDSPRPRVV